MAQSLVLAFISEEHPLFAKLLDLRTKKSNGGEADYRFGHR